MEIKECILTKNDCYKYQRSIVPKGIVVHSTGVDNPYLKRYVQPNDGILGQNKYNNDWNRSGISKCVNFMIGKVQNGDVMCYRLLPEKVAPWGVGSGKKGSYNYDPTGHIQFEICEDNLTDVNYFNKAFDTAAELCAYLCKKYNLSVETIVSHKEAAKLGYASNHNDCDNWLSKFGKDMNWFRDLVRSKLNIQPTPEYFETGKEYRLIKSKCIRRTHNMGLNIVKVSQCDEETQRHLTSKRPNDQAKFKIGTEIGPVAEIYKEKNGRVWLSYGNCWIVGKNANNGPLQVEKIN